MNKDKEQRGKRVHAVDGFPMKPDIVDIPEVTDTANATDLTITEADTNKAWEAFQRKVRLEPVPDIWRRPDPKPTAMPRIAADEPAAGSLTQPEVKPHGTGMSAGPHHSRTTMLRPRRRALRRWVSAVAAVAITGTILFTPLGADALASLYQTFRLQHLNAVTITMDDLERLSNSLAKGSVDMANFDLNQFGQLSQQGGGPNRTVTAAEAAQAAGYPLKTLPGMTAADTSAKYEVQPSLKLGFQLHTAPINKLIGQLGGKSKLPASVDNAPITIELPTIVNMKQGSKSLVQLQAPTIVVPEGVDIAQVRKAVLDLPILPEELRDKLEGIEDWRTTLPLPAVEGSSTATTVAGREAVLYHSGSLRALAWLDNGRIYQLNGSTADYPTDAAILAEAKEIIGS
ncbi:hypothetical protein [Paenibacillus sp. HJGM_3]|uniref:hypothetical protein n=1 Tax=Paenibacillus sp. HJGM_3 TaxID=3379816 RepID=UPI00385D09A1